MEGGLPGQPMYAKPAHLAQPPRQGVEEYLQANQMQATDYTSGDQQVYQQEYQYYQD